MNQRLLLYLVIFLGIIIIIGTTVVITTIIERSSNIDFFSSSNKDEETSLIGNCDLTAQETKVASLSDDKIVIICKNRIEVIDINNQKILKVINKKTKVIISIFAGRAGDTGKDPIPEFKKSLKLAKHNAKKNNVLDQINFICCNWLDIFVNFDFDIILANPPYIKTEVIKKYNQLNIHQTL